MNPDAAVRLTADGPRLIGGYSATSGLHHFPASPTCPYSGATDIAEVELPGTGSLWLWTSVGSPPPGYHGPVPYGLGIVELDGIGLRVVTRLAEPDPQRLHDGQPMVLVTEELSVDDSGGRLLMWAFAPKESA